MKTVTKIAIAGGVALLFSGCNGSNAQPAFNPNNKYIVFVEGKSFRVPYGASYNKRIMKKVTDVEKRTGCRKGDVAWLTRNQFNKIQATSGQERKSVILNGYRNGQLACAHPLSKQEYQYYMNQQNQQQANARAQMQANASQSQSYQPVNYNPVQPAQLNTIDSRRKSNNTTYLHSNGQTTQKIGNTYLYSNGMTTIGM